MKLSPQKEIIVSVLRDMKWHCGREWVDQIKDDRKRIGELNDEYMHAKGYEIKGEPCRGTACGRIKCPLYKRRAERIYNPSPYDKLQLLKKAVPAQTLQMI